MNPRDIAGERKKKKNVQVIIDLLKKKTWRLFRSVKTKANTETAAKEEQQVCFGREVIGLTFELSLV